MAAFVVVAVVCVEIFLRSQGVTVAYDDDECLWANTRAKVYAPNAETVVFIGSSRIKYDLDLPLWRQLTQTDAVQLSIEGNSPRTILDDLSNDPHFKGRLVVDVTEGLFFSDAPHSNETPRKYIKYFHDQTPAQRASFPLNYALESQLVCLDKNNFSLNARLDALQIPSRKGIFMMPTFPFDFGRNSFERQSVMTPRFVADTNLQNQVRAIWTLFASSPKPPPMSDSARTAHFNNIKAATDKIKARGGEVIFVRTPSNGPYWAGEQGAFPRAQFWDALLANTHCKGIHFQDYPVLKDFICPEWSHLTPHDAQLFTRQLVNILQKENVWQFAEATTTETN